ncbi:2-hydroxyglutaryl-CoA dehydratase [Candidatus Thorarchaeota archaeon]|nr:MAG: 2-hydroxyglutaryl-CoA dehydratase [Candidatus Thorarchaeota archaeon]
MTQKPKYGIGLDLGSTSTKAMLIDRERRVLGSHLLPTGASAVGAAERCLEAIAIQAPIDVSRSITISTGYGRSVIESADRNITEITCHSVGVNHLNPDIRLLIDVGGQDSKVIRIGAKGRPEDFELNDKCSAGTGRFLEVMAGVLEVPLKDFGNLALGSTDPCEISNTCTVFAESEVIGHIGAGKRAEDIAAGIHASMAAKIASLSKRIRSTGPLGLTGGVALNPAFVHYLSIELGEDIWVPEEPQMTGALGAAILALDEGD